MTHPSDLPSWTRRALLRGLALSGAALALPRALGAAESTPDTRFFRIGTGATSGTYFPLGSEIANALSNPPGARDCARGGSCGVPGVIAVAQATQGSVENVEAVGKGSLESALCQADIAAWAYGGVNRFNKTAPMTGLRALANLYTETLHIIVRADSGIKSLRDLKGKRVSLGEPESGTLVDARLVLNAAGLAEKDLKANYSKLAGAGESLRAGTMDAFFQIAGYPVPAIVELAKTVPIRLISVPAETIAKLGKKYAFLTESTIPADSYAGMEAPVESIGVGAQWIANTNLDADLAYLLVKALWNTASQHLIENGHPIGKRIALGRAVDGLGIPLHPGAERYYREAGLWPQHLTGPG